MAAEQFCQAREAQAVLDGGLVMLGVMYGLCRDITWIKPIQHQQSRQCMSCCMFNVKTA